MFVFLHQCSTLKLSRTSATITMTQVNGCILKWLCSMNYVICPVSFQSLNEKLCINQSTFYKVMLWVSLIFIMHKNWMPLWHLSIKLKVTQSYIKSLKAGETWKKTIEVTSHECHGISYHWQLDHLFHSLYRLTIRKTIKLSIHEGNLHVTNGFSSQRASNGDSISMSRPHACLPQNDWPGISTTQSNVELW